MKLIKKMKEDSKRLRQCKINYKNEINKLELANKKREADLKHRDAMYMKQNTVLKRKMEEAIVTSKRLKEAMDHQSAIKKQKDDKSVNVVKIFKHEMNVIHSAIDARQSMKQLT